MAAWVCVECTTTYSVGAPRCPHCGSTEHTEEGAMPKITRLGGPSIAGINGGWSDHDTPDTWPAQEVAEPDADEAPAAVEGGGESSPGKSSSTSGEKPSNEPEPKPASRRKPVQTTGSRSRKGQTESRTASGTAGGQEDGTSVAEGGEG